MVISHQDIHADSLLPNLTIFKAKESILYKYLPRLIKIRVLYFTHYITHVVAEISKVTNTFDLLSCDWRDDQIRMLQGAQIFTWVKARKNLFPI